MTTVYKELQGVTKGDKGLQAVGYRRLQKVTSGYERLHEGDKGSQRVTKG